MSSLSPWERGRVRGVGLWVSLLLLATGCQRCARSPTLDAGIAAAPPAHSSIDLRTALFTIFPEFRGATLVEGRATLERRLSWSLPEGASLSDAVRPLLAATGFSPADGGEALAQRPPFLLEGRREADEVVLSLVLPIGPEDVGKLLQTPAPLSTEQLATYFPKPADATVKSEVFTFAIAYTAPERRAGFLVRQLVTMLREGEWTSGPLPPGWEELADAGTAPEEFALQVQRAHSGTTIELRRQRTQVWVTLTQPVPAPR
ncbi:MAG: hypothetical protein ACOZIN_06485 [Myxococcota bacterium]